MDKKEEDDVAAYAAEVEAWKLEYEAKIGIMLKSRQQAKADYDAARLALIEREKARAVEQVRVTALTTKALNRTTAAASATQAQVATPQLQPATQQLQPKVVTPSMFTKKELMDHLTTNGVTVDTEPLVTLFCSFLEHAAATRASSSGHAQPPPSPNLDQLLQHSVQQDAAMVEIEGSTDEEGEPDASGSRPKKCAKKVSAAVAETIKNKRHTRKTSLKGIGM